MGDSLVKVIISLAAGVLAAIVVLISSFMFKTTEYTPRMYIMIIILLISMASYFISLIFTFTSYALSTNKDKISIGYVFLKSLWSPVMTFIVMFFCAGIPVLIGILPNKYQSFPGESMSFFGGFRGIPESMSNTVGSTAPPIAEMFYAFWGGLYGQSLASAGF
jgi:hypothetical protein